ncbi:hypothetical protein ScPMuIL_011932, partial [Solemya velum]
SGRSLVDVEDCLPALHSAEFNLLTMEFSLNILWIALIMGLEFCFTGSSKPLVVNIGAVLSSEDSIQVFKDSIAKLNTHTTKSGVHYSASAIIMDTNPIQSARSICDTLIPQGVHTVIASHPPGLPFSPPISVSYTCGFYSIPVIGISARDSQFTDKNVHPTFLRTVPPYNHQAKGWVEILKFFNWKQVIFIHSMDEEGRTILSHFQALIEPEDISVERIIKYPSRTDNFIPYLRNITSLLSRVILLSASKEDSEGVYDAANHLNLTGSEFVWVVTEQALMAGNVPIGILGMQLINGTREDAHIHDSVTIIGQTFNKLSSEIELVNMTQNTPKSCKDKKEDSKNWKKQYGDPLLLALKAEHSSDGPTGQVSFNAEGDRLNPVYWIKNVNRSSINNVGFYGSFQEDRNKLSFSNIPGIMWPGGNMGKIPIGIKISTHLKVVTIYSKPFVYTEKMEVKKTCEREKQEILCKHTNMTTGEVTQNCCWGYCMSMLLLLEEKVNFTFDLQLSSNNSFGSFERRNGSRTRQWNGMIGELLTEEADMIVAPLTINPQRAEYIDFSKPFKYQGLTILVRKTKKDSSLASFLQPFQNTLWILVGLSVHVVALVLYLLDRFSPFGRFKLAKSDDTEEDALNLSSAMWFAWGVLLNSGIGEGTPRSFSARVLGMVWAGFAMIIVASYTANLAAFLVLDRPEASITGIDDARLRNPNENYKYATVKKSAVEMYFKRQVELSTMYRQMQTRNFDTAEEAIEDVKKGNLQAFIWDSSRLEYEAARDCDLVTAGELFGRSGLGIGLRKNSPWTHPVSMEILTLLEGGQMEKLDNKWIVVSDSTACPERESAPATLGLTNMAGVFMMVAGGIVAGVFLIFIEITYKRHRGLKEKELELARNAADRWRGNIEKRRTLRQTLQKQREETQGYHLVKHQSSVDSNSTTGSILRAPSAEATGGRLCSPPSYGKVPRPPGKRTVTINNPAFAIEQQEENVV